MRKLYHGILRLIIDNRWVRRTVGKTKIFRHIVYEEAQRIIGNR